MKLLGLALIVTFAYAQARNGGVCYTDGDCDPGECCQILMNFPIVSMKRNLLTKTDHQHHGQKGTCQPYKAYGEPCSEFDQVNGYCGCGPGLKCHYYEMKIADTQAVGRKSSEHSAWYSECWPLTKINQP